MSDNLKSVIGARLDEALDLDEREAFNRGEAIQEIVAAVDRANDPLVARLMQTISRNEHMLATIRQLYEGARSEQEHESEGLCAVPVIFEIGDRVEKFGGAYGGPGDVVGKFTVENGAVRYNVAHRIEGGYGRLIHIYSGAQLRRRT